MAVQFILGRSGTGKTSCCIRAVIKALSDPHDSGPLVLLVPEQATYQAERAVLSGGHIAGYHRLNVLSFDRLEFFLLQRSFARRSVSRIGQQMIVHRILRRSAAELKIFGASAQSGGLSRKMALAITELHEYAKTPEDLDRLIRALEQRTDGRSAALKFADIALVLRRYLEFIEGRIINPDIQLDQVSRAVADSSLISGARVWVDGFSGFTAAESAILMEILKAASESFVTVCLDPFELTGDGGLFECTERMYAGLLNRIRQNGIPMADPKILTEPRRFSRCPQLAHVERNISRPGAEKIAADGAVGVFAAPDVRCEVEFVAGRIRQLVRRGNTRYRDMAVIAADLDRYEHYVRAYFGDYSIPYFIDKPQPVVHHPLAQLIRSALRAATEGFKSEEVFCCLKTDLMPLEREEVDLLENYCAAFGIDGSDWLSCDQWDFAGPRDGRFERGRIDSIRRRGVGELAGLREDLKAGGRMISAADFAAAVRRFLESLDVRRKLAEWPSNGGRPAVHTQLYGRINDLLHELEEVFGDEKLACGDYAGVLEAALSQLKLASIPATMDQVTVGSVERSRHGELKVVFLLGATQRQFPCPVESESLLTDPDRRLAEEADFDLAEPVVKRLSRRQYLSYIAFTRGRQLLQVSYPLCDERHRPVACSQFVEGLLALFDGLEPEYLDGRHEGFSYVQTAGELVEALCREPADADRPVMRRLAEAMRTVSALAAPAESALAAMDYDNAAVLDGRVARLISAGKKEGSVTELSVFAACPYRHFAMYTLGLKKRKEFKVEPLDLGLFYHEVLHDLFTSLDRRGLCLAESGGGMVDLLNESVARCCRNNSFLSNFVRRGGYNAFVIESAARTLSRCANAMVEMAAAGGLSKHRTEVWFGPSHGSRSGLGGVEVDIGAGRRFLLKGKIDRVDIAGSDGRHVAVVFDYKRSARSFDWSCFYHGLDLQLAAYMLALSEAAGRGAAPEPVGAFYLPVERSFKKSVAGSESEKNEFAYKARGIFDGRYFRVLDSNTHGGWSRYFNFRVLKNGDQYGNYSVSGALRPRDFERVLDFTRRKISLLAAAIIEGDIAVRPYRLNAKKPCDYCDYAPVCRFDPQVNRGNVIPTMRKSSVLEAMQRQDG